MMLPLITMLVFGPYSRNRFGKCGHGEAEVGPGVAVPLLVQVDAAATPLTRIGVRKCDAWKPVP